MSGNIERRRVVLAGADAATSPLRELFRCAPLDQWDTLTSSSFAHARFLLQHTPCDLLLLDEDLAQREGSAGIAWLAQERHVPIVFLAEAEPKTVTRAYEQGVSLWLPRALALEHPELLSAALQRTASLTEGRRTQVRTTNELRQCRRQVDRLVDLLWRTVPMDTQRYWCTQRHMLERLREELDRAVRHGVPLTVALGEVHSVEEEESVLQLDTLAEWTTDTITRAKRRCDVAGQYGLKGFMLLMVHTPTKGGVACCRRLQQNLEQAHTATVSSDSHHVGGGRGPLHAAFGLATMTANASTPQSLLSSAEQHLEAAKAGTNERLVWD